MKTALIINSLLLFLVSQSTQSQSALLDSSKTATTVGIVYAGNSKANSAGAGVAFSLNSEMDIRLSIALASITGTQLSGFGFSPSFEYLLYKQTQIFPLTVAAGTAFEHTAYSHKYQISEINTSGISMFSTVYHNIHWNKKILTQLSYSLRRSWYYIESRFKTYSYYNSTAHQFIYENYFSHTIGLALVLRTASNRYYVLTPAVTMSNNIPVQSIEFSITL